MALESTVHALQGPAVDAERWARFAASEAEDFHHSWLDLQCALVTEVHSGLLAFGPPDAGPFAPVALWPDEHARFEPLVELVERVIGERGGLLTEIAAEQNSGVPAVGVAYPIVADGKVHGVVALAIAVRSDAALKAAMGQLQWGCAWLELDIERRARAALETERARLTAATDLLACVLGESSYQAAGMRFVSELATLLNCERVSLGYERNRQVRVRLVSHSAQFAKRMNLMRAIAAAMEEAVEQRRTLRYSHQPTGQGEGLAVAVMRAHEALAAQSGSGSVLTIPLYRDEAYYAALTLERDTAAPFTDDDSRFCEAIAALVAAALEDKRRNDRWLPVKAWESLRTQLSRLTGPRNIVRKLVVLGIAAVIAILSFAQGDYRQSADATLEGAVLRVVAAPLDGYIRSASARAGDVVQRDQVLATLDDRDLRLERLKWVSQRAQLERQLQEAFGTRERARIKILSAQIAQAEAELELVESQLARTTLPAPFDGVVVSGDLNQRLGSAVEQGEVLFEIAPLARYRIVLQVDEGRIADVTAGQRGELLLSALPRDPYPFTVARVTPVTEVAEGRTVFRVEGTLNRVSERLRPGMVGVGKVQVDRRLLIAIWTRDLVDWLRLTSWAWWPWV